MCTLLFFPCVVIFLSCTWPVAALQSCGLPGLGPFVLHSFSSWLIVLALCPSSPTFWDTQAAVAPSLSASECYTGATVEGILSLFVHVSPTQS